ncbi:MAG: fibronectin type III domain-containing protein [Candidatus Hermodarchaeota archaeon]
MPSYPTLISADVLSNGDVWGTLWMRPQDDAFNTIAVTTQAVFAAGSTSSPESDTHSVLLVKYTQEGEYIWNQTWDSSYNDSAYALAVGAGSFYLAGMTTTGPYGTNGLLVNLDYNGNELWSTSYGNFPEEWFTCVTVGSDGIYAGGIRKNTETDVDALLVKFSFAGSDLWTERWQNASITRAFGIAVGSDGVYLVGDTGEQWGGSNSSVFLTKYSFSGDQQWNTTWGGEYSDFARGVTVFNDDIFVTGSIQNSSASGPKQLFLQKYNSTGSLLWEYVDETGLNEEGIGIHVTADSIFVGGELKHSVSGFKASLNKFNSTGALDWKRIWGGAGNCQPFGFTASPDGFFFSGTTSEWLSGSTNGFACKFSFDGKSTPGPIAILDIIYLNPYGSFIVPWTIAVDPDGNIADYELQMDTTSLFERPMITWRVNQTSVAATNLQIGTYFFRVRAFDNDSNSGPWSNIVSVSVTLVPPTVFNPWLAPAILVLAIFILLAVFLFVSIRRWRIE